MRNDEPYLLSCDELPCSVLGNEHWLVRNISRASGLSFGNLGKERPMIRPMFALAATGALLAACGNSGEPTGSVEGPVVSSSETPRNPAVDTADQDAQGALTQGANSFTEAQAREAIEKQGYTGIGVLNQNEAGIWSAPATRDGVQATVSVDYKGVVSAQ